MPDRSFLAGAAEPVIRLCDGKRKFIDSAACTEYIADMEKSNRLPYKPPALRSGRLSESSFSGMQMFTVGEEFERTAMYLHGGSYFAPPNIFHWDMLERLSELAQMRIIVPLYPRAPVHTCSAAYTLLTELCTEYSFEALMGDSAGGGLALGLAQTLTAAGKPCPDKLILISPWLDISMENEEMKQYEELDPMLGIYGLRRMGKLWAGSLDVHDPRVSPIYGDFSGIRELFIYIGTHEIFYPEVERLERLLEGSSTALDITVGEGMTHVWVAYPMREGRSAVSKMAAQLTGKIKED